MNLTNPSNCMKCQDLIKDNTSVLSVADNIYVGHLLF